MCKHLINQLISIDEFFRMILILLPETHKQPRPSLHLLKFKVASETMDFQMLFQIHRMYVRKKYAFLKEVVAMFIFYTSPRFCQLG